MKNNIYVFSREKFKEEIKALTEQQFMAGAFISIHEPKNKIIGGHALEWPVILESSSNVLNLWFNDEDEYNPETESVIFNEAMAQQIKDFVVKNKNAKFWLLHCTMGKSRSGAVGEILSEYFQIPYFSFKRDNPQVQPNITVKNILKRIMLQDSNITNT